MQEKQMHLGNEWNLTLVATCAQAPEMAAQSLERSVMAEGGWLLRQAAASERCVELEFEFPREQAIAMYGVLLAAGLELSRETHVQLTALCHCVGHTGAAEQEPAVRVYLSIYEREGSEAFLGNVFAGAGAAA
jgi:hypothetical protein